MLEAATGADSREKGVTSDALAVFLGMVVVSGREGWDPLYQSGHYYHQGHSKDKHKIGSSWAYEMGLGWACEMGLGWVHKIVHACPDPLSSSAFLVGSLGIVIMVAYNRLTWGLCQQKRQDHRFSVMLAPVSLSYLISSHLISLTSLPFIY